MKTSQDNIKHILDLLSLEDRQVILNYFTNESIQAEHKANVKMAVVASIVLVILFLVCGFCFKSCTDNLTEEKIYTYQNNLQNIQIQLNECNQTNTKLKEEQQTIRQFLTTELTNE